MKAKKIFLLGALFLAAFFVISLTFAGLTAEAADKVYRMKIQSAYPRGDLSMELLKEFAAAADKLSKGRIKIQVFADPELVPGEQLFEATKKGTLTMLHAVAAMWGGIVPVGEVEFGLPYAYNENRMCTRLGRRFAASFWKPGLRIYCARNTPNRDSIGWMSIPTGRFSRCPPKRSARVRI
jgi:TRAP-type mannitol/chloroaromatic compound transport system substrate-binding protein